MDSELQTVTKTQNLPQVDLEVIAPETKAWQQDQYITYVAASGLSITEDGTPVQLKVGEFANKLGVPRYQLYRWQKQIPEFWQKVAVRRREIFSYSRENAIWKGLTLKAMKGDTQAAQMVLSHFSDYAPPAQKHDIKVSGMSDLLASARKRIEKQQNAIDAGNNGS